jgi:hypothetical protein
MSLCVVLLKLKLWILCNNPIHHRDNNTRVRALIYCLPVLLLKQTSMPAILSTYQPLKHLSNLPLVAVLHTILIIDFFLPNFACNPNPCMSSRLCPRLVTPKDLIPLFICLINVFLGLIKSLFPILSRKRALLLRNTSYISLLLKCCAYCFLTTVKAKNPRDIYPRCFTVLSRGCCLFD